ncbi:MAG: hypothetical protein L0Y66_02195 [Myxococcaceae bacterium]|nr:hypothetical protein [Myxococcaceae bacterium]MCI0670570.1 hypothetical protein [Myxococcaceae bacterium]
MRVHARRMLAVLALVGAGCERAAPPAPDSGAPELPAAPDERPQAGTGARGVEVPMPPGWTASLGPEQSFQAGPPRSPVLRIDRRAHAAASLPTAEELREEFASSLRAARLENVEKEQGEALSLVFFDVVPTETDGGRGRARPGMLGAKAVGDDLFLCASLAGASAGDVRAAATACRELTVRGPEELPRRDGAP